MKTGDPMRLNRRELLTLTAPACAMACLALWKAPEALASGSEIDGQDVHKFDVPRDVKLSGKSSLQMQYSEFFDFVRTLRAQIGEPELIRLLNIHSTAIGQHQGEQQAQQFPDREFKTFVAQFRPPRYANSLTHEVVEDTANAFELRVTECLWATVFREAGLDGEIGHAAVCNMDYTWPKAFSANIKMERNRTLMQGHDHCNHRYLKVAQEP